MRIGRKLTGLTGLIYDLFLADIPECATGQAEACAGLAVSVIPGGGMGKLGKAAEEAAKAGEVGAKAARIEGPALYGTIGTQFGKKWGKHAREYGLDPGDPAARQWYENRINEVRGGPDEIRQGAWNPNRGGGEGYWFYRKDKDLLLTKSDGEFVSMFRMGQGVNKFWEAAAGVR
ncbi:hypothetical protein ACWED2_22145 [Amycolatopsis sp. NPDC005003]